MRDFNSYFKAIPELEIERLCLTSFSRVTEFGIDELGLIRIQGLVKKENQASICVLEKNGYVQEGLLHYYPFGREFHDVVILAKVNI